MTTEVKDDLREFLELVAQDLMARSHEVISEQRMIDMVNMVTKAVCHIHLVTDALGGDSHARANIETILQRRRLSDG